MQYKLIHKAIFLDRPNRFIAHVLLEGKIQTVHVKNTGRCKELLVPDATVYLEESDNPARKTKYDLIAVEKIVTEESASPAKNPPAPQNASPSQKSPSQPPRALLINMDSQAPNKVAAEWIRENKTYFPKLTLLKPEFTLGDSRFDFYAEYEDLTASPHKMLIEVKGCTLEKDGVALFPDAPTLRGLKHVRELTTFSKSGEYECMVLIIVQMKGCKYFTPNRETHPDFADALKKANTAGVKIIAVECDVIPESLVADKEIEVRVGCRKSYSNN
ncbi:MAG: DNA/RNA nuclease SfsA [Treponema sp.]|uniref:DNA/RNA nuclease SfsA n=1 Tax=Treponema sp. TaxID=166 RepID=UPI0025F8E51D|nr:DNA/RNA nuclease SfsA [Treponema sp.]MBR0494861.1 DNA/RNA nuclease SfsA [Treponema sp.]